MEIILQAHKSISEIFNSSPVYLVESKELFSSLSVHDVDVAELKKDGSISMAPDELVSDVVFVVSDRDRGEDWFLRGMLAGKNVLHIPTHAFDGGFEATKYTLEMCSALDLSDCVERNRTIIDELASERREFSLESARSSVRFSLFEEIRIMQTATEQFLTDGSDKALSTYTEVALIPNVLDARTVQPALLGYDVSGTFECDGCLISIHMGVGSEIYERHQRLSSRIQGYREQGEFPLLICIENTQVKSIKTKSGIDVSSIFLTEMHGHLAENILELALGTNAGASLETLDWSYNSPINESALGFHVAIGDGRHCPHVDFICACPDAYQSFFAGKSS